MELNLRTYLERLREIGALLTIEDEVHLAQLAARLDSTRQAVHFPHVVGGSEVVGNLHGSRQRLAAALGCAPDRIVDTVRDRLAGPSPGTVSVGSVPAQEVVLTGDDIDITRLPIHLQHRADAAPYVSSAIDISVDSRTGRTNVGCRRLMLRGPREVGIDITAPSDLRALVLAAHRRGEALPVAFVVGGWPTDLLASNLPSDLRNPVDELSLLAALRGAPVPIARAATIDVPIIADAEYVLEGLILVDDWAPEGPYGEYLGYDGPVKNNPRVEITAITHRAQPLWSTVTIGSRNLAHTDTAHLSAVTAEVRVTEALENSIRNLHAVHVTPASGGLFNVRVSIGAARSGSARNVMAAVLASTANVKLVQVVDDDVDVFDDGQMEWALATRFDPGRDLMILEAMRAVPLDPSNEGNSTSTKIGMDLTASVAQRSRVSLPAPERRPSCAAVDPEQLARVLASAPSFVELVEQFDVDERIMVRALFDLGAELTAQGRYVMP